MLRARYLFPDKAYCRGMFCRLQKSDDGQPIIERYRGCLLGLAVGDALGTALSDHYCPAPGYWEENLLIPEIAAIASGAFKRKNPPEIQGSGFVVKSLEAALWAFCGGTSV
jgi:hypothetical protein